MQKQGFSEFYIIEEGHYNRKQFIRLGMDYIEIYLGDKIHCLRDSGLNEVSFQKGELQFNATGSNTTIPLIDISNNLLFRSFLPIVQISSGSGNNVISNQLFQSFYILFLQSMRQQ
jgi:hypothetical protein